MVDREFDPDAIAPSDAEHAEYLSRCQVDTPASIVNLTWNLIRQRRATAGRVVDFGCGDGRFARRGTFDSYTGFEIDPTRVPKKPPAPGARVRVGCAFERRRDRMGYNTCVQNPPYVRHHDLSENWIAHAEKRLKKIDGYAADGRANAYLYFMWLGIDAIADDGLAVFVIPYEWVSRPASRHFRDYLKQQGWAVDIYFLSKEKFDRVLTTACITVIDKGLRRADWGLYDLSGEVEEARPLTHVTRSGETRLEYETASQGARANRGLSPGDQDFFVLTEAQRLHYFLVKGRDVIPAVTTFRHLQTDQNTLTEALFNREYVNQGRRCWLINSAREPSAALQVYLNTAPENIKSNYTCRNRSPWWKFSMPVPAQILYASGFKGTMPKLYQNKLGAIHVGGIHGIYCERKALAPELLGRLREQNVAGKVVPLAKGFLKIEVNQMNAVLNAVLRGWAATVL